MSSRQRLVLFIRTIVEPNNCFTDLYLLAFDGDLRPVFSNRELVSLSDTMVERDIRLRTSLGELMESHEYLENEGASDAGEDENEDELEYDSRELRRLMPF